MNLRIVLFSFTLLVFLCSQTSFSQTYHAELNKRDKLDDQGYLVEIFNQNSDGKIIDPSLNNTTCWFISLQYSSFTRWDSKKNNVMIVPGEKSDLVYVDYNNNNDFTDDDKPLVFYKNQNSLFIDFHVSPSDSNCIVQFILARKPNTPDSINPKIISDNGDLNLKFAKLWSASSGYLDFTGKAGSFYFDEQNNLTRGKIQLEGKTFAIGLYDCTKNGLYNDSTDLFMINLHGGDELNITDGSCVFKLNDVFSTGTGNYKILKSDKYGGWVDIIKTNDETTSYILTDKTYLIGSHKEFKKAEISDTIWQIKTETIFGEAIDMEKYKGSYVLLNFWGEWCSPCVNEIPELVFIKNKYADKNFKIVSFISTANKDKAIKMIKAKKIDWPQIKLTKDLGEKFKITGFPTNILILPDGKTCYIANMVNRALLDEYIK